LLDMIGTRYHKKVLIDHTSLLTIWQRSCSWRQNCREDTQRGGKN
jgi:hypothetical protein